MNEEHLDPEGRAILLLAQLMASLSPMARDRVARWATQRYVIDAPNERQREYIHPLPKLVQ